jgi:peptidoglycan/xylan/chitin deacetylase (PgdA/CDA1 family)
MEILVPQSIKKTSKISRFFKGTLRTLVNDRTIAHLHKLCARGATSLVYHRIIGKESPSCDASSSLEGTDLNLCPGLSLHEEEFEQHIRFCSQHFKCIDLSTAMQNLFEGTLTQDSLIITFDDGYRDNLTVALPILEKYNVPATIFITSGFIDRTSSLWWYEQEKIVRALSSLTFPIGKETVRRSATSPDEKRALFFELAALSKLMTPSQITSFMENLTNQYERLHIPHTPDCRHPIMLTWDEVRSLSSHPLITIGAHTHTHPVLSLLSDKEVEDDIEKGCERLYYELGRRPSFFAYPYGQEEQAGAREAQIVEKMGFLGALTTRVGFIAPTMKSPPFLLPRIAPESEGNSLMSLAHIRWKLSGLSGRSYKHG